MTKNQYQADFEKHRREIPERERPAAVLSRAELHRKKKDEKLGRVKLINILLAVFTLIPIIILLYVLSDLYSPSVPSQVPVEKNEVTIGMSATTLENVPMSMNVGIRV